MWGLPLHENSWQPALPLILPWAWDNSNHFAYLLNFPQTRIYTDARKIVSEMLRIADGINPNIQLDSLLSIDLEMRKS